MHRFDVSACVLHYKSPGLFLVSVLQLSSPTIWLSWIQFNSHLERWLIANWVELSRESLYNFIVRFRLSIQRSMSTNSDSCTDELLIKCSSFYRVVKYSWRFFELCSVGCDSWGLRATFGETSRRFSVTMNTHMFITSAILKSWRVYLCAKHCTYHCFADLTLQ